MGRPKALLPIDGQTFIERIVGALKAWRCRTHRCRLGFQCRRVAPPDRSLPVEILVNPDYKLGPAIIAASRRASLAGGAGLRRHDGSFGRSSVHRSQAWCASCCSDLTSRSLIVVPRHQGKRGHPVIFSRPLFDELLAAPLDQGAKAVVNAHRQDTLEIDTDDVGITLDIDTPELYRQHVKGE